MNDNESPKQSLVLAIEDLQKRLAEVQKSEQKYRQWFENAPISLWEQDYSEVKGRIDALKRQHGQDLAPFFHTHPDVVRELAGLVRVVDVNEATLRLYKADNKADFLSGITKVFSRESFDGFIDNLVAVADGKTRLLTERIHVALDGEVLHVELNWTVAPGWEDTYGRVLVSIANISERKRAERALRDSEEKYRLIADHMADTVWVVDMGMRFTYVSPSVTRMYGTTVEEVMSQPIAQSLTPESLETALKVFSEEMAREAQGTIDPGRTRTLELEEYKSDGSTIWVESSMSFLRDENNAVIGILGVSRDITDRKRAEAERDALEARTRQLQKSESLGRMAGAIAHHFNNQLQGVIGYLEMAMGDAPQSVGPAAAMKKAMKAANRAAGISRQMLAYLGQSPGRRGRIDLSEVYRQVLPLLRAGMPSQMVLKTDLPASGPSVYANADQMKQILINLVTNAWESMPVSGGTIWFAVKALWAGPLPTGRHFPVDWQMGMEPCACIEVRDNGPGVSEADIEKVFDPFFSTKFTGRGLGLSIALGIVTAHGGGITVESRCRTRSAELGTRNLSNAERGAQSAEENGQAVALRQEPTGTVFRVFLPLSKDDVSMPPETAGKES
jgi:PAS domain S-box-containing protein